MIAAIWISYCCWGTWKRDSPQPMKWKCCHSLTSNYLLLQQITWGDRKLSPDLLKLAVYSLTSLAEYSLSANHSSFEGEEVKTAPSFPDPWGFLTFNTSSMSVNKTTNLGFPRCGRTWQNRHLLMFPIGPQYCVHACFCLYLNIKGSKSDCLKLQCSFQKCTVT